MRRDPAPPPGCDLVLKTDAHGRRRAFLSRRSRRRRGAEGAAREPLRSRRQGREAARFLLALALPKGWPETWLAAFARGLGEDADAYTMSAARRRYRSHAGPGDDFDRRVRHGAARQHGAARRRAAGDRVFVTGTIGDAALGLQLRKEPARLTRWELDAADARPSVPALSRCRSRATRSPRRCACMRRPRWTCPTGSPAISRSSAAPPASSAEIDDDACAAVRRGAARRLHTEPALIEPILTGGDDYEIARAQCRRRQARRVSERAARMLGVAGHRHRRSSTAGEAPALFGQDGRPLNFARRSFSHF